MTSKMSKTQRGFTLLEVLVASFILFLVISTMTLVYRGALLSSGKAEQSIKISSVVPQLRTQISEHLQRVQMIARVANEGVIESTNFRYEAVPQLRGQPFHPSNPVRIQLDPEGRPVAMESTTLWLWKVDLWLSLEGSERHYEFWETTW